MEGRDRLAVLREGVADEPARDDDADERHREQAGDARDRVVMAEAMPASLSSASASTVAVSGETVIERPDREHAESGAGGR